MCAVSGYYVYGNMHAEIENEYSWQKNNKAQLNDYTRILGGKY